MILFEPFRSDALFDETRLREAVDIQQRSYRLLRWVDDAIRKGFILFDTAHEYMSVAEAAAAWLARHYDDIPSRFRPRERSGPGFTRFANYFSSYLFASFDAVESPRPQLTSPCGCYCPWCAHLVAAPHLKSKRLTASDKRRAQRKVESYVRALAGAQGFEVDDGALAALLADGDFARSAALASYADDLLRRLHGLPADASSLALWRRFAWTPTGAPRQDFELTATAILEAERAVVARLAAVAMSA